MSVLERDSGDVISMSAAGVETRISVLADNDGKVKLAIEAPADTRALSSKAENRHADQALQENYRQELLLF